MRSQCVSRFYVVTLLLFLLGTCCFIDAAEIRLHTSNSDSFAMLVIEGDIEAGDYDRFIKIIEENQKRISVVYLYSRGGDVVEAMKIGRAMRALELSSHVPMRDSQGLPSCSSLGFDLPTPKDIKNCTCASAAFFIHIGAVHRSGNYLAVHRAYVDKKSFRELNEEKAKKLFDNIQEMTKIYMTEMGVPKYIQENILSISSDDILVLDENTVKTYFTGYIPYKDEWLKAKCPGLNSEDNLSYKNYLSKLAGLRSASDIDAFKPELEKFKHLQRKHNEENECKDRIIKENRIIAFNKFFGARPSDHTNHDFNKWVNAINYIDKNMDDVMVEENFKESKALGFTYLKRNSTAYSPSCMLSNKPDAKRIINSVWVTRVKPSPEFLQKLLNTIEAAWGKPLNDNLLDGYVWTKENFQAILILNPTSADGEFISLNISKKSKELQ